jgi:hypothetical protein
MVLMNNESEELLNQAFNSKMDAAYFFFEKIKEIYMPGESSLKEIPNELFYYLDGVVFELHAASQLLLQIINIKSGLNKPTSLVAWNNRYQKLLKKINQGLYDWWISIDSSPEFNILEAFRQHISHRGGSFVIAATDEKGNIKLLSIPIRWRFKNGKPYQVPSGKSIELLDELRMIADNLNQRFSELKIK